MKIHIHIYYISHRKLSIVEPFSRNYDFKKRLKKFEPQISLKFMDQSCSPMNSTADIKNLPHRGISKRLSQFYSRNHRTYKTHFFHFFIFFSKNRQQNGFKFLQIIAFNLLHYHDFSRKN